MRFIAALALALCAAVYAAPTSTDATDPVSSSDLIPAAAMDNANSNEGLSGLLGGLIKRFKDYTPNVTQTNETVSSNATETKAPQATPSSTVSGLGGLSGIISGIVKRVADAASTYGASNNTIAADDVPVNKTTEKVPTSTDAVPSATASSDPFGLEGLLGGIVKRVMDAEDGLTDAAADAIADKDDSDATPLGTLGSLGLGGLKRE